MLQDGLILVDSSVATNFQIQNGTSLPVSGLNVGELFFLTTGTVGLYVYTGSAWLSVGNSGSLSFQGDVTGSGTAGTPVTLTLANANATPGTYGSSTQIPVFSVNAKGLMTTTSSVPVSSISIDESQLTDGSILARVGSNETITGNWTFSNVVTGIDPTISTHLATKAYVDAVATGLDPKNSVRAATTANITLSGAQTIDGVSIVAGDRVLVKNQTTASQNGIYVAASGAWTRSSDADNTPTGEVTSGMYVLVTEGTMNTGAGFVLTTPDPITLGTTPLSFAQFSTPGGTVAGGTDTQFQFNNGGVLNGVPGFTYNSTTGAVSLYVGDFATPGATQFVGVGSSAGTAGDIGVYGGETQTGTGGIVTVSGGSAFSTGGNGGIAIVRGGSVNSGNGNAGAVNIQGGNVNGSGAAGSVAIYGGTGTNAGHVRFGTSNAERFRILANGAWSVGATGSNTGTAGQALVSNGSAAAPTWQGVAASSLTGTTLASGVTTSSLTSVGTLGSLSVTGAVTAGSFVGNASSASSVPASGLTGTTLASNVVSSSLTSVGTLTALTVNGGIRATGSTGGYATSANLVMVGTDGSGQPTNIWNHGSASLNNRTWAAYVTSAGAFQLSPVNESGTYGSAIAITRTGTVSNTMTLTADTINLADLSSALQLNGSAGTAGQILTSGGSAAAPTWTTGSFTLGNVAVNLGSTVTTVTGMSSITSTTFVGALNGNASTATLLQTARTINGVSFNGSTDITVTAAAGTLTGTSLPATVTGSSLTSVGTLSSLTVSGNVTAADPSAAGHLTTKSYVDNLVAGLSWKPPVRVATTANITLSGLQTVDGASLVAGNRVLVKDQTTTSQNGIYVVASGAWTRATDFDSVSPVDELNSAAVFVSGGNTYAESAWTQTSPVTTVGTDPVTFVIFSSTGGAVAKSGDTMTGALNLSIPDGTNAVAVTGSTIGGFIALRADGTNGSAIRTGGSGANPNTLRFLGSSDTEYMRIANGNVGIGTTSPNFQFDVQGTSGNPMGLTRYTNTTSSTSLSLQHSRGTTVGSNVILQNGDIFGSILFNGANGTSYDVGAIIRAEVDGTPGATSDMPGAIVFMTSSDGSATPTERMRINAAGTVSTTGNLSVGGTLLNGQATMATTSTSVTTTSATTVDSFATASYRTAKYICQVFDATNAVYQAVEILLLHDGTNVFKTEYGEITSGAVLGTFDASISAGTLSLTFTATAATTKTVKVHRTAMGV